MSEQTKLSLLAEALETSTPQADARARLVAALQGPERWTPFAGEVAKAFGLSREDAREALRQVASGPWSPGLWPGSELLRTPALTAQRALIARMPGGLAIPHHRHRGRELTFILDGELIEDGRVYRSGELVDKAEGSAHALHVPSPCLVVFGLPV